MNNLKVVVINSRMTDTDVVVARFGEVDSDFVKREFDKYIETCDTDDNACDRFYKSMYEYGCKVFCDEDHDIPTELFNLVGMTAGTSIEIVARYSERF